MRIGAYGRYYNGVTWGCPLCGLRSLRLSKMRRHLWIVHVVKALRKRFERSTPLMYDRPQRPICPVASCGSYRAEYVRGGWVATDNFRCRDCGTEWGAWL